MYMKYSNLKYTIIHIGTPQQYYYSIGCPSSNYIDIDQLKYTVGTTIFYYYYYHKFGHEILNILLRYQICIIVVNKL